MPAPLPTPTGVVHTRLIYDNGVSGEFGHAFDVAYTGGPPSTADLTSLATQIEAAWVTTLIALLNAGLALKRVTCSDLKTPSTPDGESTTRHAGTRTGNQLAINTSAVVTMQIDRKYRGAKPKTFTPFGDSQDLTDQAGWSTSFLTEMLTGWQDFMLALEGVVAGGTTLGGGVSVSYIEGPYTAVPNSGGTRYRITGTARNPPKVDTVLRFVVQQKAGSQRRRVQALG